MVTSRYSDERLGEEWKRFAGTSVRSLERHVRDAYSHEVISHGFWPGSGPLLEPAFYFYAVPEPAGLKE